MNKNGYKEQTHLFHEKTNKTGDEELWKKFRINFYREAPKFPGNKIYAIINIEPESARKLIKSFILMVNDSNRCEFESDYREISASGFDVKKENEQKISVKIQAIPKNKNWEVIKKVSEPCVFTFIGNNFGYFNTTVSFDWVNDSKVNVLLKWNHIGDRAGQKYVVCLDDKEIQYINQELIDQEIKFYIHNLKPGAKHTIEIIAKLKNGKETCRSDQIGFTIPKNKDENNTEVINVISESIPLNLTAVNETENEDKKEKEPSTKRNEFKDRALELLQRLECQIEERKASYEMYTISFRSHSSHQTSA